MAANNNLTTLNGLFKEVYADKLENLIPDGVKALNMIPFVSRAHQEGFKAIAFLTYYIANLRAIIESLSPTRSSRLILAENLN